MSVTTFANPYLTCDKCGRWVAAARNLGEHEGLVTLMPCGHTAGSTSACPSWSPVDGCTCSEVLGVVAHSDPAGASRG